MSETRKVCLDTTMPGRTPTTACERVPKPSWIRLAWESWRALPREAQCGWCREWVILGSRMAGQSPPEMSATDLHIISVAIFCASLAGIRDETFCAFSLEYLETANVAPLLDHLEGIGAHRPEFRWPAQEPREWREVGEHEHVWLAYESGLITRQVVVTGPLDRRCTCGRFEHEIDRPTVGRLRRRLDDMFGEHEGV